MEISSCGSTIIIKGNIKSVNDFKEIKSSVDNITQQQKSIIIDIPNSLSMTSSVIGYFNKLVLKEKITIEMRIGNTLLLELLSDLNLTSIFHVKKLDS